MSNIRIKTTPNGNDKYITVKLNQEFDFIEILSLKIGQDKAYEKFCSDYGAIVGRVSVNNGFGVPNCRVSVFIPVSEEDKLNPEIFGLYPYETVNDRNSDGIRYNLLPKEFDTEHECYTPIGTFPSKREILDNELMLDVYKNYYKFTTTTNKSGDYMLFGVPLGIHTVHIDADLSNVGIISQRPYNLIEQGASIKQFDGPTKFKGGKNIDTLLQVKSANIGVNVQPFWGDEENCIVGISRADFNLNYNITPTAIFMGSLFGDSIKNSINKNCKPRKKLGTICEQIANTGRIEMIRKTIDGQIEKIDVNGGDLIDSNGAWAYQIPMNLDYVVTNENGDLVPTDDPNTGIPTRARVRFKISMDENGGNGRLRTRGKYIIPHNPNNKNQIDFSFNESTPDTNETFRDMYWNKIYTVKNFISRIEKNDIRLTKQYKIQAYTGIKAVDDCSGDKNPFPYNRAYARGNPIFTLICFLSSIIGGIVNILNKFFCWLLKLEIPVIKVKPFNFVKTFIIKLKCPNDEGQEFKVGCNDSLDDYLSCVKAALAEDLNLYQFDFYNDWVNGSLYFYLLKYKKTKSGREKFCETNCQGYPNGTGYNSCSDNQLVDSTITNRSSFKYEPFSHGLMVKYENELFYPPYLINGRQYKMFATDIVNLGSVYDCDWQGIPKIVDYLDSTTYKLPPVIAEDETTNIQSPTIIPGIFEGGGFANGLFFSIECVDGIEFDTRQALNIRRICEMGVDIPEYGATQIPSQPYVGINEIYDTTSNVEVQNSVNKYLRDTFYLLNKDGSGISILPTTTFDLLNPLQGTSFGVAQQSTTGLAYIDFRGFQPSPTDITAFQTKNSYFTYFGIIPGKTSLDKLRSNFFVKCNEQKNSNYIIDTQVTNTSLNGSNDGSITFYFIGGVSPFTYSIIGINVSYFIGPITVNQPASGIVTGLAAGTYQIISNDSIGNTVIKDIVVGGPQPLSCRYSIYQEPSNQTNATDGSIIITEINGGRPPYILQIFDSGGNIINTYNPAPQIGTIINNLGIGQYTLTLTDSIGNVCTSIVTLTGKPPISIYDVEIFDACNTCNGAITFSITGGTAPYIVTLSNATGSTTTNNNEFRDLCSGIYTINVEDSGDPQPQLITSTITIGSGPSISNIVALQNGGTYTVTCSVTNGQEPYSVFINGVSGTLTSVNQNIYTYTIQIASGQYMPEIEVVDDNGCAKTFAI